MAHGHVVNIIYAKLKSGGTLALRSALRGTEACGHMGSPLEAVGVWPPRGLPTGLGIKWKVWPGRPRMAGLLSDLVSCLRTSAHAFSFPRLPSNTPPPQPRPSLEMAPCHASALGRQVTSTEGPSLIYRCLHDPPRPWAPSEPYYLCCGVCTCFSLAFVCTPLRTVESMKQGPCSGGRVRPAAGTWHAPAT